MVGGNRGFAEGLTSETESPSTNKLPPRTTFLQSRGNRIAELATGDVVVREQELVNPALCKIWDGHNRDYASLDEDTCADLIESFKAHRRQEVPAIVRRIRGDKQHHFEVVCGARRHWTATWMRSHGFPDFKFLVEPRELTDEEAFRVADLENRSRRDLSDFERAGDYIRAVERYYDGNQSRMCERLEVSNAWLSRYLALAKLPKEVLGAFGSPRVVKISHAAVLVPLLNAARWQPSMIAEAVVLGKEQRERKRLGEAPIAPQAVVQRLKRAAPSERRSTVAKREHEVRSVSGDIIARGTRTPRGASLSIIIPSAASHAETTILAATSEILSALGVSTKTDEKGTDEVESAQSSSARGRRASSR